MKASRFLGLIIVLTLLVTLSQTMVRDSDAGLSAGTAFTVNAYDVVGNESGQGQGVLGFGENAQNAAINAASCEQTDVQAAIDSAIIGDTVVVPAGNCTWSSGVSIPDDKKITLQGAGYNNTIITISGTAIDMNESGSRITGFSFMQLDSTTINVNGTGWRIDHCKFHHNSGHCSIDANGRNRVINPSGLIDNNVFHNGRIVVNGLYTFVKSCEAWAEDLALGSDQAVYIEDNTVTRSEPENKNIVDANRAGRYVLRYNDISNTYIEAHSLQDDRERATRKWEIYNNVIGNTGSIWTPMFIRGGTGVIFGNTLNGTWTAPRVTFDNVRTFSAKGDAGMCDGTSLWDGNEGEGDEAGWPCRDQIGRSTDAWIWTTENPYPPQASAPAYLWLNRRGENILPVVVHNGCGNHIKNNRDYYNEATSFDGSSGTGYGTMANRPSTCTTGVGYWATDQGEWNSENAGADGQLYKCTSTDTWELYYTPYIYPHPLRGESLVLRATPADQAIHLSWQVGASLPPTSTWQIVYDGPTGDQPSPISGIISPTRAYTLTGLTNYTWYTVTLNAMLDSTPFLTDTVRVMPSDIFVYLPLVLKGP